MALADYRGTGSTISSVQFSPDGRQLFFIDRTNGSEALHWVRLDGPSPSTPVRLSAADVLSVDRIFVPDTSDRVLFEVSRGTGTWQNVLVDLQAPYPTLDLTPPPAEGLRSIGFLFFVP